MQSDEFVGCPYQWVIDETNNSKTVIHCYCFNRDSEECLVRIEDYSPFIYLQLPDSIRNNTTPITWTPQLANKFVTEDLIDLLGSQAPYRARFCYRSNLYYYRGERTYPYLQLFFRTLQEQRACVSLFANASAKIYHLVSTHNFGSIQCYPRLHNITMVRKLLTDVNCKYAAWFRVKCTDLSKSPRKISRCDHEYLVSDYHSMQLIPEEETSSWFTNPLIMGFDIESYSDNHKAMPRAENPNHHAFMNTCTLHRFGGKKEDRIRYGFVLGDPNLIDPKRFENIPKSNVIICTTQTQLIHESMGLIRKYRPQVLTGWNILNYDLYFLNSKLQIDADQWGELGRIQGKKVPEIVPIEWESAAYGKNRLFYPRIDGTITLDMMILVKRSQKLLKYSLDFVAKKYLNRGKHDVSIKESFEMYGQLIVVSNQICQLARSDIHEAGIMNDDTIKKVRELLKKRDTIMEWLDKFLAYCYEDTELTLDLFDLFNTWIDRVEDANVASVSIEDTYTRGTQIRCISQLYDYAMKKGYIIDSRLAPGYWVEGGFVVDPYVGVHECAVFLDFTSLYPSVIRADNLCYTTLVSKADEALFLENPEYRKMVYICEFTQTEPINGGKKQVTDFIQEEVQKSKTRNDKVRQTKAKNEQTVQRHYRFLWIKKEYREGIVPAILADQVAARQKLTKVKIPELNKKLKELIAQRDACTDPKEKDKFELQMDKLKIEISTLDRRQLARKINANGFYGFLSIKKGEVELIEAGMCTTADGRKCREKVEDLVINEYGCTKIYGDTDSIVFKKPGLSYAETHKLALEIQERINGSDRYKPMFQAPIAIEFEKMGKMFAKAKKNYIFKFYTKEGKPKLDDKGREIILIKGMAGARRDKPPVLTDIVNSLSMNYIFESAPIKETLYHIVDYVEKVLNGDFDEAKFVFVKKVGSDYKSDTFWLKVFVDWLNTVGKIIQAEDRLDILIVETDNPNDKTSKKCRLQEQYAEDPTMRIDYFYYVDHMLKKQIDDLITAGYPNELARLGELGYIPPRKRNFRSLAKPAELLCQCYLDGIPFDDVRRLIDQL